MEIMVKRINGTDGCWYVTRKNPRDHLGMVKKLPVGWLPVLFVWPSNVELEACKTKTEAVAAITILAQNN